jgi:hypothetical protein
MPYSHNRSKTKQKERKQKYQTYIERKTEKDTIHSIIKDNCQRDQVTGEIGFKKENITSIHKGLHDGKYQIEKEPLLKSPHLKGKTEKIWLDINQDLAYDLVEQLVEGEVLNRACQPCWWR